MVNEQIEAARKELYAKVDPQVEQIVKSQLAQMEIPEITVTADMISGILAGRTSACRQARWILAMVSATRFESGTRLGRLRSCRT